MKKREKTGLSPVIATVLLISIVVAIGMIIFLWARGFVKEEGTKFGKNIKLSCEDVEFEASYQGEVLSIVNSGNVPIYRVKLKISSAGGFETKELTASNGWEDLGIKQGQTYTGSVTITGSPDKILIIPVLIGNSGSGQKIYTCEDRYGYEIDL
jgi:FlaG/FlaF family flagellin (archaellin)